MATPQEKMRDWLLDQVGYVADEYKRTKYGEMLDRIGFYNGPKNGFDWCDQFYDAGLVENFGEQTTYKMTGQFKGSGGAGCWLSAGYYRNIGRWSDEPSLSAQIFFGEYGDEGHTGGVVAFDDSTVTTVEGNTDYSLGYSTGRVGKHTFYRWDPRIVGYGIPNWSLAGGSDEPIEDEILDVDGDGGRKTIRKWQRQMGTYCDGIISGQLYSEDRYRRGVWAVDHINEGSGSELIYAVQRRLAAKGIYTGLIDGCWGKCFTRALQEQLKGWGYYTGGYDDDFYHHSVESLQRSLNDERW